MNVVGRVGSYLSQSVYSVATPFHPFGGAVDIIAVQQQDGSFRSTPWYVRFGKFQGVLKGAEKIVRIEVNGVEADFHMNLDNSGEAYFIKEAAPRNEAVVNESDTLVESRDDDGVDHFNNDSSSFHRDESGASNSVDVQFQDDHVDGTESDSERRFYELDEQSSSLDGSLELSEYESSRYDNLDGLDHYMESQNLNSEVILVSVDGQILTAPITSSEATDENTKNVQLSTPQFHLGPVEGPDIVEGDSEFSTGESTWVNYLSDFNRSKDKVSFRNAGDDTSANVSKDGDIHDQLDIELCTKSSVEDSPDNIKKEDVFKSCLALNELGMQEEGATHEVDVEDSQENSPQCLDIVAGQTEEGGGANRKVDVEDSQENSPQSLDIVAGQTEEGGGANRKVDVEDSQENSPQSLDIIDGQTEQGGVVALRSSDSPSPSKSESTQITASVSLEVEDSQENSPQSLDVLDGQAEDGNVGVLGNSESPSPSKSESSKRVAFVNLQVGTASIGSEGTEKNLCEGAVVHSVSDDQVLEEPTSLTGEFEGVQESPNGPETGGGCSTITSEESPLSYNADDKIDRRPRIELSLCGNLLRPGMGLSAACEVFDTHRIPEEEFQASAASVVKNDSLVIRIQDKYFTWDKVAHVVLGMAAYSLEMPVESKDAIPVDEDHGLASTPSGRRWRLWPIPFRRVKTLEHTSSNVSSEDNFVDSEPGFQAQQPVATTPTSLQSPHKLLRTNVPTSEQISSLNLKDGQNMVSFIFSTRVLGVQKVEAHIYLWKWNARIVISDVDGTITKSDVLGQFMPLVGKDWTQTGVARLFSAIRENGYQLLFLSARAIVQAYLTRSFLVNLKQDGKALPNGPVVISPDGLFPSLFREVIRRAPHEFKIACLEDIRALFPPDYNPFYAGFGNRDTDELSYRKIGIPKGKIFIINPKGEVAISHHMKGKSYTSLHTLVNDMFPPTSMVEQEDYNSWNYWRVPLPDVDL